MQQTQSVQLLLEPTLKFLNFPLGIRNVCVLFRKKRKYPKNSDKFYQDTLGIHLSLPSLHVVILGQISYKSDALMHVVSEKKNSLRPLSFLKIKKIGTYADSLGPGHPINFYPSLMIKSHIHVG